MSEPEQHARLAPSNHRWPHCPGSVREEERYPDIAGEAAIDGTGSHLLLEYCFKHNVPASAYLRQVIGTNHPDNKNGWLVNEDRVGRVQQCLDYVTRRYGELKEEFPACDISVESESKSDPGGAFGRNDWYGTCDITITVTSGSSVLFIEVIDYKDGRGKVEVARADSEYRINTQLLSYMFGKLRPYVASGPDLVRPFQPKSIKKCRFTIVQPKTNPSVRYEECSVSEVIEIAERLGWAAHQTDKEDAPLKAGDHCRWCKANPKRGGHCTAIASKSLEAMNTMSDNKMSFMTDVVEIPAPPTEQNLTAGSLNDLLENFSKIEELDGESLSKLAEAKAGILSIFDRVEAEIDRRIESGMSVPGWDKQPGNGKYVWNADEETIAKALKGRRLKKEDIYPAKLITPAQVDKHPGLTDIQKKKIREEFVSYIAGKPTLKRVAHQQKETAKDAKSLFADVPTEQPAPLSFI